MIEGGSPKNLVTRAQPEAEERGALITSEDLTSILVESGSSDPFISALGMQIHKWDAAPAEDEWTRGTPPSTTGRRDVICQRLGIDDVGAAALLEKRGIFRDETIVITAPWDRWYT